MNPGHSYILEWLEAGQEGRMPPVVQEKMAAKMAAHLAACPACRDVAELTSALRRTGRAQPEISSQTEGPDEAVMINKLLRLRQRQKVIREPLLGLAWAAGAAALVLVLSWILEGLLPGEAGRALGEIPSRSPAALLDGLRQGVVRLGVSLAAPAVALQEIIPGSLFNWIYHNFYVVSLAPLLLMGLLGAGLARRGAQTAWTFFLLGFLAFGVGTIYWELVQYNLSTVLFSLLAIVLIVAAGAMLWVHVYRTFRYWSRWELALVILCALGLILFFAGPWYGEAREQVFSQLFLIVLLLFSLIPAVLWLAWEWGKPGRWIYALALFLSLLGLVVAWLDYYAASYTRYPWLAWIGVPGIFLLLPLSPTLALRLVLSPRSKPRPAWVWPAIAGLWAAALLLVRLLSLENSTSEDRLIGSLALLWLNASALMAAVAFAWAFPGRRLGPVIAFALLFSASLIPAAYVPLSLASRVTEARLGQVNQAILRFAEDKGRYPSELEELNPRYLLLTPAPLSHWQEAWCYEVGEMGGEPYYRLGYADPVYFTYPGDVSIKELASGGEVPDRPLTCSESWLFP